MTSPIAIASFYGMCMQLFAHDQTNGILTCVAAPGVLGCTVAWGGRPLWGGPARAIGGLGRGDRGLAKIGILRHDGGARWPESRLCDAVW